MTKPVYHVSDPRFPEVLDSSMMATFKSCPQLFKKLYVEDWKSKEQSVHLVAGGAFAKGMEVTRQAFHTGEYQFWARRYKNPEAPAEGSEAFLKEIQNGQPGDAQSSIAIGLTALMTAYGDFQCPADSAKSLERTAGAFEYYWERYPLTLDKAFGPVPIVLPSGRRGIEFSFAHPLPIKHPVTGNPLIYAGRCDSIDDYLDGVYLGDEKTTSSLGATWSRQWDLRSQFMGYSWACHQSGIEVDGTIVRGVSILKTKYDTQQAIVPCAQWQREQWYEDTLSWIEDIIVCWHRNEWKHNFDHACGDFGGCAFRLACGSQEEDSWLSTYFERRQWDPITRIEHKL